MSHWIPHCARSWLGNKILSFMDEKNWSTKNTDNCQRVLRMQSEKTGQCWVQDFSSLALCCMETELESQAQLSMHDSLHTLTTVHRGLMQAHMQTLLFLCPETCCYTSDWPYPDLYLLEASLQAGLLAMIECSRHAFTTPPQTTYAYWALEMWLLQLMD